MGNSLNSPKIFNSTQHFIPRFLLCSVEQLPFSPYTWLFSSNGQCYCQVLKIHHLHLLLLCILCLGCRGACFFFFYEKDSYLSGIKLQLPGTSVGLALHQIRQEAMHSLLIFHFLFMSLLTYARRAQKTKEYLRSLKGWDSQKHRRTRTQNSKNF